MTDIAIIGAGPYGLSIAAHLKARGLEFRIFGKPMHTWLANMPMGMRLKSEGFASSLYAPNSVLTLEQYCKQKGIPYADRGLPVPLETFVSYGLEFQRTLVPEVEEKLVVSIDRCSGGFHIGLADGEIVAARKIVIAAGLNHFEQVPPILSALPEEFVTHSSKHRALDHFKGREVAVVGAGASALDLAALLHQAGAAVQVVTRKSMIRFHDPPGQLPPPLIERIGQPMTGIGPGWKLFFYANLPLVFRQLPESYRLNAVRRVLGPAPGWFVKEQVVGKVPFNLGVDVTRANAQNGRVSLQLTDKSGISKTLAIDHVISATGYKVDLRRLTLLAPDVLGGIRSVDYTPVLSSNFESSVPGLHFVGPSAANTFGPLLRFAFGAGFTALRLTRHFAGTSGPVRDRSRASKPPRWPAPDRKVEA